MQFNTKMNDNLRSTQSSSVYLVVNTMQVASAKDKRHVTDNMKFYGVVTETWELDYDKFRILIFKCDSVRGVKVADLGFTLVNLNRKCHLNDTFVLGKYVEQIFYVEDPANPRWSVVLRIPARDYNDSVRDDNLGDTIIAHHPIATTMPSIESFDNLTDADEMGYMRANDEDILVDGE